MQEEIDSRHEVQAKLAQQRKETERERKALREELEGKLRAARKEIEDLKCHSKALQLLISYSPVSMSTLSASQEYHWHSIMRHHHEACLDMLMEIKAALPL